MTDNASEHFGALNKVVGFHIRLAHGAISRHFAAAFQGLDLTQKQVSTMWMVERHPGISQSALGNMLQMDRATTMTIVSRLETRAYIRREPSQSDGRKRALYIEEAGKQALKQAKARIEEHEQHFINRFTADELESLLEMLARIHE